MIKSLIITAFFVLGTMFGFYEMLPEVFIENDFSIYALSALMFLVGVGTGADKNSWKILKKLNLKIVMVPLTVIFGTFAGVTAVSLILKDITLKESLAVGAGFGYYSLSSVFISRISGETLGVVALISNVSREIITLLTAPLLVKFFGKIAPIASGGATAMDTTLPVITKFSGKDYAIIAVFSGIVLTVLVPLIVTIILNA
ncbi:lysine exporter LysO family protein [candidate division WOR-3 bacterium]|nr:lysine exporter LysO family protein [candidate division WOR-3 bacterium]